MPDFAIRTKACATRCGGRAPRAYTISSRSRVTACSLRRLHAVTRLRELIVYALGARPPHLVAQALVRIAKSGIYLVRGVPRDLRRTARARAVRETTSLSSVLWR